MVSANLIRDLVSDYVLRSIDLESFSKKFSALFENIEDYGEGEAINLSCRIESSLADLSAGLISEDGLRKGLTKLVTVYSGPISFGNAPDAFAILGMSATSMNLAVEPFGTGSVAVFSSIEHRQRSPQTSTGPLLSR